MRPRGEQIARRLAELDSNPWVREVRGLGLMWGVELADPRDGRPATKMARAVQAAAVRRGLILEVGGRADCVVRMLPPLNVSEDVVDIACSIVIAAIEEARPAFRPAVVGEGLHLQERRVPQPSGEF